MAKVTGEHTESGKRMRRTAILFAGIITVLALAAGTVAAAETIECRKDKNCLGTPSSDTMQGTAFADTMVGFARNDTMHGDLGDDAMRGDDGFDTMYGGYGEDRMYGGADNDVLEGNNNADTIVGGPGADVIDGGLGPDTVVANDGKRDSISCGVGFDTAVVDTADLNRATFEDFVRLSSCEDVRVR